MTDSANKVTLTGGIGVPYCLDVGPFALVDGRPW